MLSIRNLSKNIGDKQILSQISLTVDKGEFIALVGASGSGKTTLLRCLSLKEKWTSGQYIYDGKDVTALSAWDKLKFRKYWAYVEQKPRLNPQRTALKNVLSSRIQHMPIWRLLTRSVALDEHMTAMDALEKVGLLDRAHYRMEKLSGGEQQRVAIARALIQGANVIVADDPIGGLDPERAKQIIEDLRSVCQHAGVTIICSMHQVDLAEKFADRIWGLAGGKIVVDVQNRRLTQREKDLIFDV
jgi:phosphonate transport system ATP-binding protein